MRTQKLVQRSLALSAQVSFWWTKPSPQDSGLFLCLKILATFWRQIVSRKNDYLWPINVWRPWQRHKNAEAATRAAGGGAATSHSGVGKGSNDAKSTPIIGSVRESIVEGLCNTRIINSLHCSLLRLSFRPLGILPFVAKPSGASYQATKPT